MLGMIGRVRTLEGDLEPYLNYFYPTIHEDDDTPILSEADKMRFKFREFFAMIGYIQ